MADLNTTNFNSTPEYDNDNVNNDTNDTFVFYPVIKVPPYMIATYSLTYSLVFVLGLVGNILVVLVVLRNPCMRSVTNYFLVNLAIADILVCLFCVPINLAASLMSGWIFGSLMCKMVPFLQGLSVNASINTLMAIAIDRYMAICRPLQNHMTRKMARSIIAVIWVVAALIMSPWIVYFERFDISTPLQTIYVCGQAWPSLKMEKGYFLGAIFLTCYTIPLCLISACYALIACRVLRGQTPGITSSLSLRLRRSRVRALEMLVVVVILFALSWLPLYAIQVRRYFGGELIGTEPDFNLVAFVLIPVAQWLSNANSCINPFIYCFFSSRFRNGFRNLVCTGSQTTLSISRSRWQTMRRREARIIVSK